MISPAAALAVIILCQDTPTLYEYLKPRYASILVQFTDLERNATNKIHQLTSLAYDPILDIN
jgi:hypothetical protein